MSRFLPFWSVFALNVNRFRIPLLEAPVNQLNRMLAAKKLTNGVCSMEIDLLRRCLKILGTVTKKLDNYTDT